MVVPSAFLEKFYIRFTEFTARIANTHPAPGVLPGAGTFLSVLVGMRTDVRSFLQPIESRSLVERYEKDHNRPAQHATSGDTFEASAKSETRPLWLRGFPWSRTPYSLAHSHLSI